MPIQHGIPCYLPYTICTEKSRRSVYLSAFTVEGLYVCISAISMLVKLPSMHIKYMPAAVMLFRVHE